MRTQSARVPFKAPAAAVIAVPRKLTRAALVRPHSHSERIAVIAGAALAVALLLAGAAYTMRGDTPPPIVTPANHPFLTARVARIVIPGDDGVCREHGFDNERGVFGEARVVVCPDDRSQPTRGSSDFSSFKFGGR